MPRLFLDTTGMKCPLPLLKLAMIMPTVKTGDILEISGNCETFDNDIRRWCGEMNKTLVLLVREHDKFKAEIQF